MGSVCAIDWPDGRRRPGLRAVAGMAMGLVKEGDKVIVLSDIMGDEDHAGDMDFKVAGTTEGITALQMDIKITGVTLEILKDALQQANEGRQFILGKMAETISEPREQLSQFAPRITSIQIDPEKIGAVIGKGGETIRGMSEEFQAEIDVEDDGTIRVYAPTGDLVDACVDADRLDDQGRRGRRQVQGQGGEDHQLRSLRRAHQGHRRSASHLEREAWRARRRRRGRPEPGRRDRRHRGRGRQGAWPYRTAPLRGP